MVKNVFNRMKNINPVALAIIGWLAFVFGLVIEPLTLKLMFLSAARVLP